MKKYRVNPDAIWANPNLSTQLDGVPISLNGKVGIHVRPESKTGPRKETPMRIATQEDLKRLFEMGNSNGLYQEYDEQEDKAEQALLAEAKKDK